jgi:hypothetical protein
MNLLDTASLVVTPNGYKAGKLYSIIPEDGSGDMTFSRTGNTGTRVNANGLIEGVNANIPRLDYLDSTCPKVLLEPQRTNLLLQSQDISSASWLKGNSPTIVANVAIAPDGTTTADSIQQEDAVLIKTIQQYGFTVTANSTYTFSLFIKKETSKTNFGAMNISFSGGVAKKADVSFDEVNGTMLVITGSTLTPILKVDDYGTYWRFNITATDNGSNTSVSIIFYPAISTTGTNLVVCNGSARTIWGAQLEAGSFATSYIPTTTASVTRNLDSCSKSSISSILSSTEGTLFVDFVYTSPDAGRLTMDDGSTNNRIWFTVSSTGITVESRVGGTPSVGFGSGISTIGTRYKIAFAYKNNDFAYYINGGGQFASSGTVASTFSRLSFDSGFSSLYFNNKVNSLAHWKTRLTNSELATLTTI